MADFDTFLIASPRYFEPMSQYQASSEYLDVLSTLLPNEWKVARHDVWLVASAPGLRSPGQGFKIHVSTTAMDARAVLERVVQVCLRSQATFKVAADRRILAMLNAKRCPRGSSGKFMTVYPRDTDHFSELLECLYEATNGFAGPYILSDRRYKDSKVVFYRYGGFIPRRLLLADGTTKLVMEGPGGREIEDQRMPYFSLPEGIVDPFPASHDNTYAAEPPTLQNRFQIIKALAFSNSGGVYAALDRESQEQVVVKEARPYTHSWSDGSVSLDAVRLLQREYETLGSLCDLRVFPKPIGLFQEWEHWFLVQEFVGGEPLRTYRAREDVNLLSYIYEPDEVASFAHVFRKIAQQMIAIVEDVHARGYLLGDISPNNVFVDPSTLGLRLIDVESACRWDDPPAFAAFSSVWRTPGFRDPKRYLGGDLLAPADDWYALGMLLQGLILPLEGMVDLHPEAVPLFLRRFVDAGLPQFIEGCITNLLSGDLDAARRAVAS